MKPLYIKSGNLIFPNLIIKNPGLSIDGSKITSLGKTIPKKGSFVIYAKDNFISSGFIDCHIHGDPRRIFSNEVRFGTTSVVLAISCDRLNNIYKKIDEMKRFKREDPFGSNVLGVHLEGPYINKKRAGAQDKNYIRRPNNKELQNIIKKCGSILKIMTIAPELKGAVSLIKLLRKNNILASLGHSDATFEEAKEGIKSGIRHATHIFNAMRPIDRRDPGAVGAVLSDDKVSTEIILDLIHVHESLFALLLKSKEMDKIILVTDSIAAESLVGAKKLDGVYRFKDGRIAGSSLTMIEAIKNAVKIGGLSLVDAVKLATINPAKLIGANDRKGEITAGKDADIVIFDRKFDVKMTVINGKIVYRKRGF